MILTYKHLLISILEFWANSFTFRLHHPCDFLCLDAEHLDFESEISLMPFILYFFNLFVHFFWLEKVSNE